MKFLQKMKFKAYDVYMIDRQAQKIAPNLQSHFFLNPKKRPFFWGGGGGGDFSLLYNPDLSWAVMKNKNKKSYYHL